MNIARKIITLPYTNVRKNVYRKFRIYASNCDSSTRTEPKVQDEKFDFEDLKVLERLERRKARIPPFMKDIFVSIYNRDLLAYPEILNKEESTELDERIAALEKVFLNTKATVEDRKEVLKSTGMYGAPLNLTNGGLAMNVTESLRYLDVIAKDLELGRNLSAHWVGLNVLKKGLSADNYNKLIDDLTSGDATINMCIQEKIPERLKQADFSTTAEMDSVGVWHITGHKICNNSKGYMIVLCLLDSTRFKAFLVHPNATGISTESVFVTFHQTPATPIENISEEELSKTLGIMRLYTATLCRNSLVKSLNMCMDYVKDKCFSGKSLTVIPTIRATIGDTMLKVYASESAEYFTAGLLDGYLEPDAEMEVAMCRNFIAKHAQEQLLKLLAIPGVEKQAECLQLLEEMRSLSFNGETVESINTFIALNGIHHAGKELVNEVKQIRNPLFNPSFIIKKMILDRHQERDDPKLTLHLYEHLHPTLKKPSEQLEYCVLRMRFTCETLMSRHGRDVAVALTELSRLAEAATEILVMSAVLARASRAYCIGLRNSENEMKLASVFIESTKDRVKKLLLEANEGEYLNLDYFRLEFGKKVLESKDGIVEKPTARVFW